MNARSIAMYRLARPRRLRFLSAHCKSNVRVAPSTRSLSPTTTYIICTNPRSGSWLLGEGLTATARAGNPREWFNIQEEQQQRALWRSDHNSDLSLRTYLRLVRSKSTTSNGVSGIKLHYYQFADLPRKLGLPESPASELMMRLFPGAKYIWLRRRDKARQAISLYIALSTNEWWAIAGIPPEKREGSTGNLALDPRTIARLERVLEQNEVNWQSFFQENGITPLVIHYEDLASEYTGTITAVLKWLGIADADAIATPSPRLQRQSDARSEEWLARYTAFKGNGGALAEEPDESSNPLSERIRRNLETIPSAWKQWIAQTKTARTSHDAIVEVLVKNGCSREAALAEMKNAASDPYLIGSARRQQRLNKAVSLLNIQGQLARLDSRVVVVRRSVLSREEFRDHYYAANRPVVIQGLMTEWRATAAWTPEYLKSIAGGRTVEVMTGRDADPRYEMNAHRHCTEMRFADYVDMVYSGKVTNDYCMVPNNGFLQRPEAQPLLRDFTAFPEYLRPAGAGAGTGSGCFLWFGPAGTVMPLHHETSNILLAQVAGQALPPHPGGAMAACLQQHGRLLRRRLRATRFLAVSEVPPRNGDRCRRAAGRGAVHAGRLVASRARAGCQHDDFVHQLRLSKPLQLGRIMHERLQSDVHLRSMDPAEL
jgi:LPS sulfotransferase NodH